MLIKQYGITLRRVEKRDIELIRKKRNSERIKNNMLYREHITKKMQIEWFKSIEKSLDLSYYIIIYKRQKIGLINTKRNSKTHEVEAGLFIFDEKYYNSFIPVISSVLLIKVGFYIMKVNNDAYIKVLKTNKKAINYNKSLGYYIIDEKDNYYIMRITIESFERATKKILKAIKNMYGNSFLEYTIEEVDFKLGLYEPYKEHTKRLGNMLIKKIEKENYKKFILDI